MIGMCQFLMGFWLFLIQLHSWLSLFSHWLLLKWVLGFRARELFYYLKGGQVDYGEEHSKACGHSQFGRVYEQGFSSPALLRALYS